MQLGFGTSKVGQIEMNMWKYYGIIFPKVWDKPTDTLFCVICCIQFRTQIPRFLRIPNPTIFLPFHRFSVVKNMTNRPFLDSLYTVAYKQNNSQLKALSHYCVSYQRMPAYEKYHSYVRWKTLTYARGTLDIGCIRFQHGRIRWHTARQKLFLSMRKNFVRIRTYGLYDKHILGTR